MVNQETQTAPAQHAGESRTQKFMRVVREHRPRKRTIFITVSLTAHIIGAVFSIHAVMHVRYSQAAVAWAIGLNTMPYVAVPAYLVVGGDEFYGYKDARRIAYENFTESAEDASDYVAQFADQQPPVSENYVFSGVTDVPRLPGNSVDLLIDGEETFASIFEGIAIAKEYALVQFYTVRNDDTGMELQKVLLDKSAEGVPCYFLYDKVGSQKLSSEYLEALKEGGVHTAAFDSSQGFDSSFQVNFRNHRKVVVVDGKAAWLGGFNVGDEYRGLDPEYGEWRDTHVRIEGPAALAAQLTFLEDWYWATGEAPGLHWEAHQPPGGNVLVHIIPSGPTDDQQVVKLLYLQLITGARERIWIASPYFVPDFAILSALELAAFRGVDVKVLISEDPTTPFATYAAYTYIHELSNTDVEVYIYEPGYNHQKVVLKDSDAAVIGTVNLDNRSIYLNFEISALIEDEAFVQKVAAMLEKDFEHTRLLEEDAYTEKGFWFRFAAKISRLAAPLL